MKISKGHAQAFGAYLTWGVFPIYWKYLKHLSSLEILFHRVIWGFAFLFLLVVLSKKIKLADTFQQLKSHFLTMAAMAALIGVNWLIYVYAVNAGYILQGSLAYFMTPIMNIVLGAWIFNETLSRGMKIAASVAAFGVLVLILLNNQFPWIAISLALTFAVYGVIKKKTHVGGLESSFLENLIMFFPALIAALYWRSQEAVPLTNLDYFLLVGCGAVTALPILLFSLSTRAVPLNHSGVLQFMAPSIQFLIGYFMYNEPVSNAKLVAFVFVWIGVALYIRELWKPKKQIP